MFDTFSDLRTTRARLLEMFTDVTCNPEIMKNATDAYFSLLQGMFTFQQNHNMVQYPDNKSELEFMIKVKCVTTCNFTDAPAYFSYSPDVKEQTKVREPFKMQ